MLKYLVRFLKACAQNTRIGVLEAIQGLVLEAFNRIGLGQLRSNRSEIKNYLAHLGGGSCFSIPEGISEEVFQGLVRSGLRVLLVPQVLVPDEPHQLLVESLYNEDAVKILRFVSTLGENRELEKPERTLVQQVIAASHWDEIRAQCNSFRIFTAYDCRTRSNVSISLSQLTGLRRKRTLFAYSGSQAMSLQQALDNASVTLIDKPTLEKLGWDDEIIKCNEHACLQVLESKPTLNCPEERVNLLNALLPAIEDVPAHKEAMRYLIHAHPSDENQPLFMEASAGQGLWPKIASQVLQQRAEKWRVIGNVLRDRISQQYRQPLGIHEFDADGIAQLILEVGPENVDCTIFSINERQQILREMKNIEVLRGLNVYSDIDGNIVRVNPDYTYWESDFPCEDIPRENIVILSSLPGSLSWRQGQLLDRFFTAKAAIHVCLGMDNPHKHWTPILRAIDRLNSLPSQLNLKIKNAKWLPIGAGRSPQDVIYVKDMEDEVARIVAQFDDLFVDVSMLPERFRAHPGYKKTVRYIFPKRDDALEMLGEMMAESEKYRIGDIDIERLNLEVFLATFAHAPRQLMSSHSVLQAVSETFDEDVCRERLLPKLCQRLPISNTVDILNFLAERHEAAGRNRKSGILLIFNRYLKAATNRSNFMEVLRQIRLLSRGGNWKPPAELCLEAEGIEGDDLLDTDQSSIVSDHVKSSVVAGQQQSGASQPLEGNEERKFDESAVRLEQYFNAWEGAVPSEVIGGFLALLGNHSRLLKLSTQYLGVRTYEAVRGKVDWEIAPGSSAEGANEDIHQTMRKQRFLVDLVEGGTAEVTNLLRAPFHARIGLKPTNSLFVGSTNEQFHFQRGMSFRVNRIKLRSIQLDEFSNPELCNLIKDSAALLLNKVYKQAAGNLDDVFDDLAQSEQLDIRIAQNLLLDNAFFYVRQLETRQRDGDLGIILQKWDEAHSQKTEAEHNGDACAEEIAAEAMQQEREQLKNLIQSDVASQNAMLTAVRHKVKEHYQYKPRSIPFELFQNADDAVVERFEIHGNSTLQNTDATRFVIRQEDHNVAFIHWGRPINKFRSAYFNGREKGFDRDLQKILSLSHSDKSESTGTVTGKFGLGFKSVFLVTSKPRVASGQLGFEAVGGFFPKQLTGDPLRELQDEIKACQNDGKEGTIISIQAEECSVQEFLKEFRDVVHFLPVFARRIRRCDWIRDGQTESWEWNDRPLAQSKCAYVGELQPSSDGQRERQTAVVFRASQGDLLVGLDAQGAVKLEKSVPAIWVTVPTKERCDLGFIVNGRFDLDVGRAQLAKETQRNKDVADSIGQGVGEALIELFDEADRHWEDFCDSLNLVRGASQYQFWYSLWRLFNKVTPESSTTVSDASQLIRRILWDSNSHGMAKLFSHRSAIPSGLWGDYEILTKVDKIRFKTVGALDAELIFSQAARWPQFQQRIEPGHVVSDREITSVVMSLLPDENESVQEIRLCDLVQWELGLDNCVDVSQASRLGSLITREFLNELNRSNRAQQHEYNELKTFLSDVRFQAHDGEFHAAEDLLIKDDGADNRDEPLRAAFAPDDRILNDDYTDNALEFFKACRPRLNAPLELLVEWAEEANPQTRHSVLEYLLNGQLRREIAVAIQDRVERTWLRDLTESPLLTEHFDSYQQSKILSELESKHAARDVNPTERSSIERVGMETVMCYERKEGRNPEDVSAEALGYDIRSTDSTGVERYIEVKARRELNTEVSLTQNELSKAKQLGPDFFLHVIFDAENQPEHYIVENPAERTPPKQKRFLITRDQIKQNGLKIEQ